MASDATLALATLRALDLAAPTQPEGPRFISAASGLVCVGSTLYVVADDELHLARFSRDPAHPGELHRLLPGELPLAAAERKKSKPDFEALVTLPPCAGYPNGAVFALGSGSKRTRHLGVLLALDRHGALGAAQSIDLQQLHARLGADFDDLNLEGAAIIGAELILLQRGNTRHHKSALIYLALDAVLTSLVTTHSLDRLRPTRIRKFDLGGCAEVPFGFTDGVGLPNGYLLFAAVAEDTSDSYQDGACRGALVGVINREGEIIQRHRLTEPHKIEGIHATVVGSKIDLLAVTDGDDRHMPARLLAGRL